MANAWDSDEIRSLENNIRNNFVNSYNGQTKIDSNDSRLTNIERERQEKISQSNAEYNKTINDVNSHYNILFSNFILFFIFVFYFFCSWRKTWICNLQIQRSSSTDF